ATNSLQKCPRTHNAPRPCQHLTPAARTLSPNHIKAQNLQPQCRPLSIGCLYLGVTYSLDQSWGG
ncbi:hypothetical protein, partial [Pseudoalteromonas sp. S185]|uniref:hypothetical protein n=1 Tax=Pseudoalteromonas sp. S185 TaxID=2066522 RepID=UPI001BB29DFF